MDRRQWFASLFAAPAAVTAATAAQAENSGWYSAPRPRYNLAEIERGLIIRVLREFNGNQTKAALDLGLSRRSLAYRMEKLGMRA